MYRRFRSSLSYRPLRLLLVALGAAWAFWWLDLLRVLCDPENHWFQGHAIWHLLNSSVFYFLYRFYVQFPESTPLDATG